MAARPPERVATTPGYSASGPASNRRRCWRTRHGHPAAHRRQWRLTRRARMKAVLLAFVAIAILGLFSPDGVEGQVSGLSISGTIWEDVNADGVRQPGEGGLLTRIQLGK